MRLLPKFCKQGVEFRWGPCMNGCRIRWGSPKIPPLPKCQLVTPELKGSGPTSTNLVDPHLHGFRVSNILGFLGEVAQHFKGDLKEVKLNRPHSRWEGVMAPNMSWNSLSGARYYSKVPQYQIQLQKSPKKSIETHLKWTNNK